MPLRGAVDFGQTLPDCDHVFSALRRQFMMEHGQRLNPGQRAPEIDEQQDPIKRTAAHIERFSGDRDRLAKLVVGHAPRLGTGNV